jgi:hypothetical protein
LPFVEAVFLQALHAEPNDEATWLALATYEERDLPAGTLAPARLAVLADALIDTDCTEPAILEHLRSPGPMCVAAGWWIGFPARSRFDAPTILCGECAERSPGPVMVLASLP